MSIYSEQTLKDCLSNVEKVIRKWNSNLAREKSFIIKLVLKQKYFFTCFKHVYLPGPMS